MQKVINQLRDLANDLERGALVVEPGSFTERRENADGVVTLRVQANPTSQDEPEEPIRQRRARRNGR